MSIVFIVSTALLLAKFFPINRTKSPMARAVLAGCFPIVVGVGSYAGSGDLVGAMLRAVVALLVVVAVGLFFVGAQKALDRRAQRAGHGETKVRVSEAIAVTFLVLFGGAMLVSAVFLRK
jgi:hypothetical protein